MQIPWYTGAVDAYASADRARRQMGAVSSLASNVGSIFGQMRKTREREEEMDQQQAELDARLHPQEQSVKDATTSADDVAQSADMGGDPTADQPESSESPIVGSLSRFGRAFASTMGLASPLTADRQNQALRLARSRGELGGRSDATRTISALSSLLGYTDDPTGVVSKLRPDLGLQPGALKQVNRSTGSTSLTELAIAAAQGDPVAVRALSLVGQTQLSAKFPPQPQKPTAFQEKMAFAEQVAREAHPGRQPTKQEIADAYKANFGSSGGDFMAVMTALGLVGGATGDAQSTDDGVDLNGDTQPGGQVRPDALPAPAAPRVTTDAAPGAAPIPNAQPGAAPSPSATARNARPIPNATVRSRDGYRLSTD